MKVGLIQLLTADKSFTENKDIAMYESDLSREKYYGVLVVAPGWKPAKIMADWLLPKAWVQRVCPQHDKGGTVKWNFGIYTTSVEN